MYCAVLITRWHTYRHTVSCYYLVKDMETLEFEYKPLVNIPSAEIGTGQLMVEMRLALGKLYCCNI